MERVEETEEISHLEAQTAVTRNNWENERVQMNRKSAPLDGTNTCGRTEGMNSSNDDPQKSWCFQSINLGNVT